MMDALIFNHQLFAAHLPLLIILVSFSGAFLVAAVNFSEKTRDLFVVFVTFVVCLLSLFLLLASWQEVVVKSYRIGFAAIPLIFKADRLGGLFNFLSSFIWFLASLFSLSYMAYEKHKRRYYTFYLLTLGGCLGVFLTGDFFSLFFFFEIMSLASYLLVIHTQTKEALKAGKLYLFISIFGGLCLLFAVMLLYGFTGSSLMTPMLENLIKLPLSALMAFLFITGFGIKAGMVPLHIWLPKAHPVAPSPASALLSGVMIKTGAYGIFRVINVLYTPAELSSAALWQQTHLFGFAIIWLGILTMLVAAFLALFQTNAKRTLAYSSVSQMGYILMGVGAGAYLGTGGAMATGGFALHVLNHAFFKAGLFMMVGVIYLRTGELDIRKLGGLWRDFPVTAMAFLVAALGIAGVPGLNGYTGKVLLHHAILEAAALGGLPGLAVAERIFMLTSVLTACYMARLFSAIFLGPRPSSLAVRSPEAWNEKVVFSVTSLVIIFIGLRPGFVLQKIIAPLTQSFSFSADSLKHLAAVNFWVFDDLAGMVVVLLLAALLYYLNHRFKIFSFKLPAALSVEGLIYRPLVRLSFMVFTGSSKILETVIDGGFIRSTNLLKVFCQGGLILDLSANQLLVGSLVPLKAFSYKVGALEHQGAYFKKLAKGLASLFNQVYQAWFKALTAVFRQLKGLFMMVFNFLFRLDYKHEGRFYRIFNTEYFEYYLLVFFIMLIIIMSLRFLN